MVTTKPPELHLDSLSRQLPNGEWRESGCVRFALNGILQARLGQDIASCRMFDLPSKPPSTLELSGSPSHVTPTIPFPPPPRYRCRSVASQVYRGARRFSRTSSISVCRNFYQARSNKGYYAAVGKRAFPERSVGSDARENGKDRERLRV